MAKGAFAFVDTDYDPSLPLAVHESGLPGYAHRWIADLLPTGAVTSWESITTGLAMTVAPSGTAPVVKAAGGFQYVECRGGQGLRAPLAGIRALTFVFRIPTAAGVAQSIWVGAQTNLRINATNQIVGQRTPAGNDQVAGVLARNVWAVATVTVSSARENNRLVLNGAASPAPVGAVTGGILWGTVGRYDATTFWDIDVAEVIAHTGADSPTLAEVQAQHTALRERFGF